MVQDKQIRSNDENIHSSNNVRAKRKALKDMIIIGGVIFLTWYLTVFVLSQIIPSWALTYIKIAEILIIGYFFVEIVSNLVFRLTSSYFGNTAHSIKIFIRIASAIVIAAIVISYLSKDPLVAAFHNYNHWVGDRICLSITYWKPYSWIIFSQHKAVQGWRQHNCIRKHWPNI